MKVYRHLSEYKPEQKAVVTVGVFDGVHIGHQKLLQTIAHRAAEQGCTSVLLTFDPHPRLVLFPEDNDLKLLTTLEERIALLQRSGLHHLVIHPFTVPFSRTTAVEYVRDILVKGLGTKKLVIGYDHHFGRNREGNFEHLRALAPQYGFEVDEIPAQEVKEVNVSSTKIRAALLRGEVAVANDYLGYRYSLRGSVRRGQALGRTLNYPTANVQASGQRKLIPGSGVYATRVSVAGSSYDAMTNIGVRPSVSQGSDEVVIESHLFGFDQNIYGEEIAITFVDRLRDERHFESMEQLKIQLGEDALAARHILDHCAGA